MRIKMKPILFDVQISQPEGTGRKDFVKNCEKSGRCYRAMRYKEVIKPCGESFLSDSAIVMLERDIVNTPFN